MIVICKGEYVRMLVEQMKIHWLKMPGRLVPLISSMPFSKL